MKGVVTGLKGVVTGRVRSLSSRCGQALSCPRITRAHVGSSIIIMHAYWGL